MYVQYELGYSNFQGYLKDFEPLAFKTRNSKRKLNFSVLD